MLAFVNENGNWSNIDRLNKNQHLDWLEHLIRKNDHPDDIQPEKEWITLVHPLKLFI